MPNLDGINFVILLTVIIYGIGKSVVKMSFGDDKTPIEAAVLSKGMYLPQLVFISAAIILGIYMPPFINNLLQNAVSATSSSSTATIASSCHTDCYK